MSMTRKEALNKLLEMLTIYPFQVNEAQAIGKTLEVLRTPTREQVERMRGEWISTGAISCKCSRCCHLELKTRATEYSCCPLCMSPMTDEAVDMILKRMEEIYK